MRQDGSVDLPQPRAGLNAEFVLEKLVGRAVRRQRVSLAAAPVEREHPLRVEPLVKWVAGG